MSRPNLAPRQRGISMIEVLAAMVIFSSSAVVLFGWISQTTSRLAKLDQEQKQLFAELAALDFMRGLNPMRQPEGKAELQSGLSLSWQAEPVGLAEQVRVTESSLGLYQVQLFKVSLKIQQGQGPNAGQTIYLAGWRQTAELNRALPFQN